MLNMIKKNKKSCMCDIMKDFKFYFIELRFTHSRKLNSETFARINVIRECYNI